MICNVLGRSVLRCYDVSLAKLSTFRLMQWKIIVNLRARLHFELAVLSGSEILSGHRLEALSLVAE